MTMNQFDCSNETPGRYFARPPERLVLEGYRHWTLGKATQQHQPWETAVDLYLDILGKRGSKTAIFALSEFVNTLERCADCPLRTFKSGSRHICREEALVMGLIAGIQNDDARATELCLTALTCRMRCEEMALAAGSFALILRGLGKTLLPIPSPVIRDILDRSRRPGGPAPRATLH